MSSILRRNGGQSRNSAVRPQIAAAPAGPNPAAAAPAGGSGYHGLREKRWKHWNSNKIGTALKSGKFADSTVKFGLLLDNYYGHLSESERDKGKYWAKKKWTLPDKPVKDKDGNVTNSGNYGAYNRWAAPIFGALTSGVGLLDNSVSFYRGVRETNRKRKNIAAGESRLETAKSALDTSTTGLSAITNAWGFFNDSSKVLQSAGAFKETSGFAKWMFNGPGKSVVGGGIVPGVNIVNSLFPPTT